MGKNSNGKELGKGIRQKPSGLYEARYMIDGVAYSFSGTNLQEVKARLQLEKAKARSDLATAYKNATLNDWFDEWFDSYKKRSIKSTSVVSMRSKYTSSFGRIIGDKRILDITNMDIQKVVNQLADEGRAVSSIRDCLGRVRECLESAKNNRIIPMNPCFEILLPQVRSAPEERRYLSHEEQKKFLTVASEKWYKEMFFIMFLTGMRVGEVGGLKWEDIDFEKKEIHVKRSLSCQYDHGVKKIILTDPKTYNSFRTIPFMGEAEEMLLSQKKKQDQLKEELGDRWRSKFENLVFCTTMGSECSRYIVEKEVNKIVDEINAREKFEAEKENRLPVIFERCFPHAIRHTFCSRCYERGIDAKITQRWMGHSSITITLDYYTHLSIMQYSESADKFGRMMA